MFGKRINFALIIHYVSLVLIFESLFMIPAAITALIYDETALKGIMIACLALFSVGSATLALTWRHKKKEPGLKESLLVVSLSWITLGITGALPYLITGSIPGVTDAVFESVSGFTTTGSSILQDIEALPKSILLWRSVTHWIGGMGIIVMVIAVMPFLNIHGSRLFSSEASVVVEEKVTTRMRYVARNFGLIYLSLTFSEIFLLWLSGMPLFDSLCHSFGTIATGGFGTKNASIAGYSPLIQYIIALFMTLSGMNFTLHFFLVTGRFRKVGSNPEMKYYLAIIGIVTAMIAIGLWAEKGYDPELAFRSSFFQVSSIITATGFITDDYLKWPIYAQLLIVMLMLIGASAGSTGGGVKVIRHVIFWKTLKHYFRTINRPKAVFLTKYGNKTISAEQTTEVIGFIILYYLILVVGTFVLVALGNDFATSFSSVATTMEGCGPGFGAVGPVSNFSSLNELSKLFLCGTMITGRLEIYPILLLFTRGFWRA